MDYNQEEALLIKVTYTALKKRGLSSQEAIEKMAGLTGKSEKYIVERLSKPSNSFKKESWVVLSVRWFFGK